MICHTNSKLKFLFTFTKKHTRRYFSFMTSRCRLSLGFALYLNHTLLQTMSMYTLKGMKLQASSFSGKDNAFISCLSTTTQSTLGLFREPTLAFLISLQVSSRMKTSILMIGFPGKISSLDRLLSHLMRPHHNSWFCLLLTSTECKWSSWKSMKRWYRKLTLNLKWHWSTSSRLSSSVKIILPRQRAILTLFKT